MIITKGDGSIELFDGYKWSATYNRPPKIGGDITIMIDRDDNPFIAWAQEQMSFMMEDFRDYDYKFKIRFPEDIAAGCFIQKINWKLGQAKIKISVDCWE